MTSLAQLLQPDQVTFLEGDRDEVLTALCQQATRNVAAQRALGPGVAARESIAPTVLECGVAVPHCHVRQLDDFVLAVGICRGGVDWDGRLVRAIILVGSPEGRQLEYVRLLSSIATLCDRTGLADRLASCETAAEVVDLLSSPDAP